LRLIRCGWRGWLLILRCRNKRTAEKQQRAAGQQDDCRHAETAPAVASVSGNANRSFHGKSPRPDELLGGKELIRGSGLNQPKDSLLRGGVSARSHLSA
jgi:hypothetical protein